jgi:hypothetical protein
LLGCFSSVAFVGFAALVVARRFRVGLEWLVAGVGFDGCLRGAGVARDFPHCEMYKPRLVETDLAVGCAPMVHLTHASNETHRMRTMGTLARLALVLQCSLWLRSNRW